LDSIIQKNSKVIVSLLQAATLKTYVYENSF